MTKFIYDAALQHQDILKILVETELPIEDEGGILRSLHRILTKSGRLPSIERIESVYGIEAERIPEGDLGLVHDQIQQMALEFFQIKVQDAKNLEEVEALKKKYLTNLDQEAEEEVKVYSSLGDIAQELDDIFQEEDTVKSGFPSIDATLGGGMVPGETYCFVAPSGVGKSIWLINLARTFINQEKNVVFVSTEMNNQQVKQRLLRSLTDKADKDEIKARLPFLKGLGFNFLPIKVEPNVVDVDGLERMVRETGFTPDVLIIDYMDELRATEKTPSEYEKYKILGSDLKRLAERFECPLITASQTNRSAFENGATKGFVGLESIGDSWNKVKAMSGIFTVIQDQTMQPVENRKNGHKVGAFRLSLQKSRFSGKGDIEFTIDYNTMHIYEGIELYYSLTLQHRDNKEIDESKENGYVLRYIPSSLKQFFSNLKDTDNYMLELKELKKEKTITHQEFQSLIREINAYQGEING